MDIEIKNPRNPTASIPIAEIFAMAKNSSLVGFFKIIQTLLLLLKKAVARVFKGISSSMR